MTSTLNNKQAAADPEEGVGWVLPDYWGEAGPPPGHLCECHPDLVAMGTCWCRIIDDHSLKIDDDPNFLFYVPSSTFLDDPDYFLPMVGDSPSDEKPSPATNKEIGMIRAVLLSGEVERINNLERQ